MRCEACNGKCDLALVRGVAVFRCRDCAGLNHDSMSEEESYRVVLPYMADDPVPPEQWVYYDFSGPGYRRHGWYDPNTGLIQQVG